MHYSQGHRDDCEKVEGQQRQSFEFALLNQNLPDVAEDEYKNEYVQYDEQPVLRAVHCSLC